MAEAVTAVAEHGWICVMGPVLGHFPLVAVVGCVLAAATRVCQSCAKASAAVVLVARLATPALGPDGPKELMPLRQADLLYDSRWNVIRR